MSADEDADKYSIFSKSATELEARLKEKSE